MILRIITVAGLLFSLAACVSRKQQEVKFWGEAQGSTYSILYIDEELRNFQDSVEYILQKVDESMSTWIPTSLISRLNAGETIVPDEYFKQVLKRSHEVHQETNGIFDLTVAPILNAWGMGNKAGMEQLDAAVVDSLRILIGMDQLLLKGDSLYLGKSGMQIDFNAIAQGYTVDLIAEFLESQGIKDYMVEVGGEIRANGNNKQDKPWRIGIDKPVDDPEGRPLQVILKLDGQALATSGSYRKFRMKDGVRYSHAIDPRNGQPVQHSLLSVTVITDDCMTADAYATALLIMGVEASMAFLEGKNMEAYFISDDGAGNLTTEMTPGFGQYVLEDVFE